MQHPPLYRPITLKRPGILPLDASSKHGKARDEAGAVERAHVAVERWAEVARGAGDGHGA